MVSLLSVSIRILYVTCSTVCYLQYCMLPAVLYVTCSTVCYLLYCMLPAVLYVACSTVCCLQYCMSPVVLYVACCTVRCLQYCILPAVLCVGRIFIDAVLMLILTVEYNHMCSEECRGDATLPPNYQLYHCLAFPLMLKWKRTIDSVARKGNTRKPFCHVYYVSPCGRRLVSG